MAIIITNIKHNGNFGRSRLEKFEEGDIANQIEQLFNKIHIDAVVRIK